MCCGTHTVLVMWFDVFHKLNQLNVTLVIVALHHFNLFLMYLVPCLQ